MFTVERDIPPPSRGGKTPHYGVSYDVWMTFRSMEIGDSFVIPNTPKDMHLIHSLSHRFGFRIKTKRTFEGERRVWLVSKTRQE
jgi:hypothetical protein